MRLGVADELLAANRRFACRVGLVEAGEAFRRAEKGKDNEVWPKMRQKWCE